MRALFRPILTAATWRDRLPACIGAGVAIALVGSGSALLAGGAGSTLLLVAPIGASAVLVFCVPASPLAQPWPVIGGNALSALIGIAAARWIELPGLAALVAVVAALLAMSLTRSLHPPGGAAALLGVLGGPAVLAHGYAFALVPVALNAGGLVVTGLLFHRWSGHSYPHRPPRVAEPAEPVHSEDIDLALGEFGEPLDVAREDLDRLIRRAVHHSRVRRGVQPR